MPILSGVPSLCYTMDARTREMTEFFDIPSVKPSSNPSKKSMYEWYCETDYSKFNANFSKRFDDFEIETMIKGYDAIKEKNKNLRIEEIKLKLSELDLKTIRALREGGFSESGKPYLEIYQNEIDELRNELQKLT